MSLPRSEPARQPRLNRAVVPLVELFSHPPQAEESEQRPPLADAENGVDWRATPFSGGAAEQTPLLIDEQDQRPGRQRQARRVQGSNHSRQTMNASGRG
jgi:hypothetical protein